MSSLSLAGIYTLQLDAGLGDDLVKKSDTHDARSTVYPDISSFQPKLCT